ncbi:tetratricopeptide repeat protein 39B-like protein [Dinothrombium tinctorium]|nr:tetratricopeptide repeat protein 39B-like protein [Dinothrombium tinctorium]
MLPTRVLKIISLAGFNGDRKLGEELLRRSTNLKDGLRYRISALCIMAFSMYADQIGGLQESDFELTKELMKDLNAKFPTAIFVSLFSAKFNLMQGKVDNAINEFLNCINYQDSWKQIHHACRWDLAWAYAIKNEWENAAKQVLILREQCSYSPASNMFAYAAFKMMQLEDSESINELRNEIDDALRLVPNLKIRYAGKTIPQEKFLCTRAIQFVKSGNYEPLVALLELFYVWNVLSLITTKQTIEPFLQQIDEKLSKANLSFDQIACLLLTKGVLLRNLGCDNESMKCFETIVN